ncbi:MAG: hypothetical protein ACKE51_04190, partial [Methylococcaceae bacterium]
MAIVLIESDSAGFSIQISSQNREANTPHPIGESEILSYIYYSIVYEKTKRSTDFSRLNNQYKNTRHKKTPAIKNNRGFLNSVKTTL